MAFLAATTCLVIDRQSYKQLISNKFTIPDYQKMTKKATADNEFKALRLRDLRIVATLGVGGKYNRQKLRCGYIDVVYNII